MDTTERWYVIMTAANRESDAYVNLRRQGYSVFYPRRWHTWSRDGHTTSELRPYLSRYLFVAVRSQAPQMPAHAILWSGMPVTASPDCCPVTWRSQAEQSVAAINDTDGVSRVLTLQGNAYEVPSETMWDIRKCFDPDGIEPPGARTAKHIRKMLRGVKGEDAAELLSAIELVDDRGRVRYQRSRAVRLAAVSLPLLKRKAAENSHFRAPRPCPMGIFQENG